MSFMDDLADIDWDEFNDPLDFSGRGAASDAMSAAELQAQAVRDSSGIQVEAQERGLEAMLEQLGITREQFAPFLAAGTGALGELQEGFRPQRGSTQKGLEESLAEIMGGESFGALRDERTRGVQGQLSAGGLTRSGRGLEAAASVPTDLAFEIENMLYGRGRQDEISRIQGLQNLVGTGLNAAGASGSQAGNLTSQVANLYGNIGAAEGYGLTGSAEAIASGIYGANQARGQGATNIASVVGSFFGGG